ncbi:uncharacterized protein LOC115762095 [Drosophila novamexicana]|uniref:uncharacterized protein LOC115762095 n=1 Tax=Drosophila novamexicana TaxID=47314 RepID=UPI0011E5F1A9|nr:uncharacterized protein LOC115762095 [Drosophila novamexicana]
MLLADKNWSLLLNLIIERYLHGTTICVLWHDDYEFQPQDLAAEYSSFVDINIATLASSFEDNVVDAAAKRQQLKERDLVYDDLLLKLTLSIEMSHCESFLVFGEYIPRFVAAFTQAAMYSIWRSLHNKFIFAHVAQDLAEECYRDFFFQDQPNILFVVRSYANATDFELKTNKYVGPRSERPDQLELLDRYDAMEQRFQHNISLFPDKLRDLQGRELIMNGFDYRPYTVIKYGSQSNARDIGVPDESELSKVYIDGTETRVVFSFCAQFNCTVQIDTSDAYDWGTIYPNMTGDGSLGMIIEHKVDICIGAMYSWYDDYTYLDLSMYLARSGITCLVPAPLRLASWYLPLQPFQGTLWAAVLFCLGIETLGLVLAHRREQELYASTYPKDGWWQSTKFGLVTTFKLFISQSGNSNARSVTVRVLLFACFLNDIIITSIYGGGLASILTIPSLGEAADTMQRMRNQKLQWAANSEAWVSSIRGSDDPLVHELLSNFHIYTDDQLLDLAQRERMGFTVERLPFGHFAIGDYLTRQAIEHMVIMQEDLYYEYTVAFVPRLWPLLERFNELVYRWHSSGFDKYWEYRVVADNLNVQIQQQVEGTMSGGGQEDINIEPVTLAMSNFAGILLVWVLGVTVALMAFVAELMAAKVKKQRIMTF